MGVDGKRVLMLQCGSATCRDVMSALTAGGARVTGLSPTLELENEQTVEAALDAAGVPDVLVNTLGMAWADGGQPMAADGITALSQYFYLLRGVGRRLAAQQGGEIIHVVPDHLYGDPERPDVAAFAGGMLAMTRGLALEWEDMGVTANLLVASRPVDAGVRRQVSTLVIGLAGSGVTGQALLAGPAGRMGRVQM